MSKTNAEITKAMVAANETTTTDEHGVVRGACLMCADPVPLEPGGAIGRHSVATELMGNHAEYAEKFSDGVICLGTGHTREHGDGRDDARRFGIRHCSTAEGIAARSKAKMDGLDFAGGLDYSGEAVLIHHSLAKFWRNFAIHGEWPTGMRDALRFALVESGVAGSPIRAALVHAQALAARQWIREAKWELARVYHDGVPGEDFAAMLFSV